MSCAEPVCLEPAASSSPARADSTAAADAAAELQRLKRALGQAQREARMGRLLARVAHDLNNPLTVILGRAELLADDAASPVAVRGGAQRIVDAARRCGDLLQATLGLARAPRGRPPGLAEVVRGIATLLGPSLRQDGITLSLALDDDALPAPAGDAVALTHALLALLDNAQQALVDTARQALVDNPQQAVAGAANRRITLAAGADAGRPGRLWLRVTDSGHGVPTALAARIFEPFFSTRPDAAGLGLGLARDSARAHGGDLLLSPRVAAADGTPAGASFELRWPAAGR